MGLGIGSFGHNQQSRGVLVYSVHKSHSRVVDIIVGIVAEMKCQRVYKSAVIVAVTGMHHKPGRLVDHEQMLVLVHDVERNILGYYLKLVTRTVHDHAHHIERLHAVVGFHRLAVDENTPGIGGLLYAVTRRLLDARHKKLVDTQQLLSLIGYKTEMFI